MLCVLQMGLSQEAHFCLLLRAVSKARVDSGSVGDICLSTVLVLILPLAFWRRAAIIAGLLDACL